jgi:hypothetical protein
MVTQSAMANGADEDAVVEQKVQQLRDLYADAPEVGKVALENGLSGLKHELAEESGMQSAGRIGARQGMVSELTAIAPLAEGGANRLRRVLQLLKGSLHGADRVGSLHDMRFVFLDDDTRLLFATAYDGDWDAYIDDFVTKIPNALDLLFCNVEGWPGIHSPSVKDWLVAHQSSAEGWYVANPDLTVVETRRLQRIGQAVDEFLDKVSA